MKGTFYASPSLYLMLMSHLMFLPTVKVKDCQLWKKPHKGSSSSNSKYRRDGYV